MARRGGAQKGHRFYGNQYVQLASQSGRAVRKGARKVARRVGAAARGVGRVGFGAAQAGIANYRIGRNTWMTRSSTLTRQTAQRSRGLKNIKSGARLIVFGR